MKANSLVLRRGASVLLTLTAAVFCPLGFVHLIPPVVGLAFAEDKAKASADTKSEDKDVPLTTGVITSIGKAPRSGSVNSVSTSAAGESNSPISGSLNFVTDVACEARLTNTSEKDSYSVKYSIVGTDGRGSIVVRNSYSASLKPGQTVTNRVSCRRDLNMQVVLSSGSKKK